MFSDDMVLVRMKAKAIKETNFSKPLLITLFVLGLIVILGISAFSYFSTHFSLIESGAFCIFSLAIYLVFCWIIFQRDKIGERKKFAFLVVIAVFSLGILSSAVFPPGSVPDEPFHYKNSYFYANKVLGINDAPGSLTVRQADYDFMNEKFAEDPPMGIGVNSKGYNYIRNHLFDKIQNNDVETFQTGVNASSSKGGVPQERMGTSLGILLGFLFSLNPLLTFYLARLLNLLLFCILLFLALKVIPFGSKILAAVALLPMTINLVSSLSYDSAILGFSFLLIALLLRAIKRTDKFTKIEGFEIGITAFLLTPLKIIYTPLLLLFFLVPSKRFKSKKKLIFYAIVFFLAACLGLLLCQLPNILAISTSASYTSSGIAPENTPTLSHLITNPIQTAKIFIKTLYIRGGWYINTEIGSELGWFQATIAAPWFMVPVFQIMLFLSAQRFKKESASITTKTKMLYIFICFICSLLMFVVFYLSGTANPLTSGHILEGIQGRYFLPFLPLLLLVFRVNRFFYLKDWSLFLPVVFFALNYWYIIYVFVQATKC